MSDKQTSPLDAEKNKPEKVAVFRILEEKISFIHTTRRRQTIFSVVGIVVILLILGMLLSSLYRTAANFDTEEFVKEIGANSAIITSSPELQGIGEDFQKVFLPALQEEFAKTVEQELPNLKKQKDKSLEDLRKYLEDDLSLMIIERLEARLSQLEQQVIKRYDTKHADALAKAFERMNQKFVEELTTQLEGRLDKAIERLSALDDEMQSYKQTKEFASAAEIPSGELENRLLETFLELWIYQLNPIKASEPAFIQP